MEIVFVFVFLSLPLYLLEFCIYFINLNELFLCRFKFSFNPIYVRFSPPIQVLVIAYSKRIQVYFLYFQRGNIYASLKLKEAHSLPSQKVLLPTEGLHVNECQVLGDYGFLSVPRAHLYLARQLDIQEAGFFSSRSISMFPVCVSRALSARRPHPTESVLPFFSSGEGLESRGEFCQDTGHRRRQGGLRVTSCLLQAPTKELFYLLPGICFCCIQRQVAKIKFQSQDFGVKQVYVYTHSSLYFYYLSSPMSYSPPICLLPRQYV